jgi:transposase
MHLFADAMIAIDCSKFKAVNNCDKNYTQAKLKKRMLEVGNNIQQYLEDLDVADIGPPKQSISH